MYRCSLLPLARLLSSDVPLAGQRLAIEFKRVDLFLNTRGSLHPPHTSATTTSSGRGTTPLDSFENRDTLPRHFIPLKRLDGLTSAVDGSGLGCVVVTGVRPMLVVVGGRGEARVHPMLSDGPIHHLTPFFNPTCSHGFLYFNESVGFFIFFSNQTPPPASSILLFVVCCADGLQGGLRIARLEQDLLYDAPIPVKRVALRLQLPDSLPPPHLPIEEKPSSDEKVSTSAPSHPIHHFRTAYQIVHHVNSAQYALLTHLPISFHFTDEDEEEFL